MKKKELSDRIKMKLFLSLLFILISNIYSKSIEELYDDLKASVVVIKTDEFVSPENINHQNTYSGLGSGVLISKDGLILTAAHVVESADQISVEFINGESFSAEVVSSAPYADVALIKIANIPRQARIADLSDSDSVKIGQQIFVIGAPYGIEHSLSVGYLSGKRQQNNFFNQMRSFEFLQTDAAINKGNSGGPMFNLDGKVIGIVSHILSFSGGFEGLGFAASSNMANELVIEKKSMWTGIDGIILQKELAKALNIPQDQAILIQKVAAKSPASRMGLKGGYIPALIAEQELLLGGDIILAVDNIKINISNFAKIKQRLDAKKAGDQLSVTIMRDSKKKEITIARKIIY